MSRNLHVASAEDIAVRAQPAPVVRFDAVSLRRSGESAILRGASFALAPGSFHILTGAAGCGKTTVLGLICLAEPQSSGRIQLFGLDTTVLRRKDRPALRRRIGVVFQDDRLIDHLTVFDNAALVPRIVGRKPGEYRTEVIEVLTWVGLGKRLDATPSALSPGEKRRLAIARAVANRPDILIADEPTGGIDAAAGRRILRLLAELNQAGTTVVMASRDEALAASSGAPILSLRDGRISTLDNVERAVAS